MTTVSNEKDSALLQLQLQRGRASLQDAATLGAQLQSMARAPNDNDSPPTAMAQPRYAAEQDRHVFRNTSKPGYDPNGPQPGAFPQPVQEANVVVLAPPPPPTTSEGNIGDDDHLEDALPDEQPLPPNDEWWKKYSLLQDLERWHVICIGVTTLILLILVVSMSVALGITENNNQETTIITTRPKQRPAPTQPMVPTTPKTSFPSISSQPSAPPTPQPSNAPSKSSVPSMSPSISNAPTLSPSQAPTSVRRMEIMNSLPMETRLRIDADSNSPQAKALQFVVDGHSAYPEWRVIQRFALATVYYATNGDEWNDNRSWLHPNSHECGWQHVQRVGSSGPCGSATYFTLNEGVYESLSLYDNNLVGTLPPELFMLLTSLKHVDLGVNKLEGPLSPLPLSGLKNLERLNLENNAMEGKLPAEIGFLTQLTWLSLSSNRLKSSIPSEVGQLSRLTRLSLSINNFDRTIPSELARLDRLESLFLDRNRLIGSIPQELEVLAVNGSLVTFTLDWNSFHGVVPYDLCGLGLGLVFDCSSTGSSSDGLCGCTDCPCADP
ncbi:Leucine Rich Repeat [Seminavis robusta]|uniref:Leucine Rich Repeat n=1 Tax=Seminavis robusta TaxID=568900 RepID=A0A9N8HNH1_9STRA|nr:Leucine Rich Repeat [Seminavis robusta]|eukprot:Sro819_g207080.1 Leucine Rich Repeat (551) ;mRNA; r:18294-20073